MLETLIGSKIAHIRALKGLSQEELAEKAKMSKSYISQIETGVKYPAFKATIKIAKALKVDWKELAIAPIVKKIEKLDISDKEKQELSTIVAHIENCF